MYIWQNVQQAFLYKLCRIACCILVAVARNICRILAVQNVYRIHEFRHGFRSKPIPEMNTPPEIMAVPEHFVSRGPPVV